MFAYPGFLGFLLFIIQLVCVVHAFRNGRYLWLVLIVIGHFLGTVIYFLVEILPDLRAGRGMFHSSAGRSLGEAGLHMADRVSPRRKLSRLQEQLQFSDTVSNRKALAEAYLESGDYPGAIELYESCLQNPSYRDDAQFMLDLARTRFYNDDFSHTADLLERLLKIDPEHVTSEGFLLYARALETLNRDTNALEVYARMIQNAPSAESHCRYGLLLEKQGQKELAIQQFHEVLYRAQGAPKQYLRSVQQWLDTAQSRLQQSEPES